MAKKRTGLYFRDGFWTRQRLEELEKLWKKKTLAQLSRHFDKPELNVQDAYDFQLKHKKLHIKTTKLEHGSHVVYAAAPATGIFDFQHP